MPNDGISRGMDRPGRRSEGRQWNWRPQRRPPEADGRRLHTEVGPYLAMDGDRLNFLTHMHVRASHYRLSAGSATRDRPPAGGHDLSKRSACEHQASGSPTPPDLVPCASSHTVQRKTDRPHGCTEALIQVKTDCTSPDQGPQPDELLDAASGRRFRSPTEGCRP